MKKHKASMRVARKNWLRFSDHLKRKRDRQRGYERRRYDAFSGDEAVSVES